MHVAVGSENPVKVAATERALADVDATVVSEGVPSGVAEQPRGHAETVTGAQNRARAALETGEYDLGVGLEGGVATYPGTPRAFVVMWAAATDGDRVAVGSGPGVRLPDAVAARIDAGEELGPVMDDAFDLANVAENEGAVGVLTANAVDRTSALAHAVAGALGPFRTPHYD